MRYYRIKNWATNFETHETRKLESLRWVALPNKHDGLGYRRVAAQPDACELFTAWTLMLQVASRGTREERGDLLRDGAPLSAEDLALMTGFSVKIFTRAFEFFSSQKMGWLEIVTDEKEQEKQASPGCPGSSPGRPGDAPALPGLFPAPTPLNGMEGKEGKGRVERPPGRPRPTRRCPEEFTLTPERLAFAAKEGLPEPEAKQAFAKMRDHEFRTPRVDWEAVWRNWVREEVSRRRGPPVAPAKPPARNELQRLAELERQAMKS
jgi:hypothetical protein